MRVQLARKQSPGTVHIRCRSECRPHVVVAWATSLGLLLRCLFERMHLRSPVAPSRRPWLLIARQQLATYITTDAYVHE